MILCDDEKRGNRLYQPILRQHFFITEIYQNPRKERTKLCRDQEEAAEAEDLAEDLAEADSAAVDTAADSVEATEATTADPTADFTADPSLAADFSVPEDTIMETDTAEADASAACWAC